MFNKLKNKFTLYIYKFSYKYLFILLLIKFMNKQNIIKITII